MTGLNKTEALKYLRISERTLERWVKKYKIAVRYENTEHGRQPFFEMAELDRVKKERSPTHHPAISSELAPIAISIEERSQVSFWAELAARSQLMQQLSLQLTLSLDEAAVLSGIRRSRLLKAARYGKLKAIKLPEWRIRLIDLREYIDRIFEI
ncbi:helix-turn-helix domain-containing protein [Nostoc sp.]|uniref:helix-turn-helix domain-containing protein n=1 Tax=Nostoc sp. TaxID=1180 RepID=UPI002FF69548